MRHPLLLQTFVMMATLATPTLGVAQDAWCVPGNPLYDGGDYRCFERQPRRTHARAEVVAHVEAARYLSGGALRESQRAVLEDHFDDRASEYATSLPSIVDGSGGLHTPDVRLAVVFLASGNVGRVRVLTRHSDALDRRIAQSLAAAVSRGDGVAIEGAEVELIVRLRPRLRYTRWRTRHVDTCCVDDE